jgi:hypothetical protein
MAKVFISYSSKNRDLVKALAADIEELGHDVWFDKELTGGHIWWESILQAIRNCEVFVFALSPESLNSHPCSLEYKYAHAVDKTILPILLSGAISFNLLPHELTIIQSVDYRQRDTANALRLGRAFTALPTPKPLPETLPTPPVVPVANITGLREKVDNPASLTFEQQAALFIQIKEEMKDPQNYADGLELLRRFRERDDLLASVAREVEQLFTDEPTPQLNTKPPIQQPTIETPVSTNPISQPTTKHPNTRAVSIWTPNWTIIIGSIVIWVSCMGLPSLIYYYYRTNILGGVLFLLVGIPWGLQGLFITSVVHGKQHKTLGWYLRAVLCGGLFATFQADDGNKHLEIWHYILGLIFNAGAILGGLFLAVYISTSLFSLFSGNSATEYIFFILASSFSAFASAYVFSVLNNIAKRQTQIQANPA